tara:strand:+ start:97 stop:1041 length:945 start_codon:yes stop_codon:yes gene_type:complete
MADTSAFKKLYSAMINNAGDLSKVQSEFKDASGKVKKIKCFVKESFPHFLVTDNHFYVPCYFTKKAYDDFRSKHAGCNVTDLKSKVVEIGDWSLEMAKVDSSTVFTSYAGVEIRLIVKGFKLVQGTKDKILLSRYPMNLFRDDEMKTLFQAYHHRCLAGSISGGIKGDSLPDVSKRDSSVVSFASGDTFKGWTFKVGTTVPMDIAAICRLEKGAEYVKKLKDSGSSSGKVRVISKAGAKKSAAKKSINKVNIASKLIKKSTPGNAKHSTKRIGSGKHTMKTPTGTGASATATPKPDIKNFNAMKKYLAKMKVKK